MSGAHCSSRWPCLEWASCSDLTPSWRRRLGEANSTSVVRWLLHGLLLAAILTIPLTLGARGGANHLDLLGLDPAVLELTRGYFRLVAWSILPLLLYVALRRYLQAVNVVRPVMLALVTANVINAGVNWLLVFGNAGFPELGVEGAAWATCISRTYMCAALAVAARSKVASMAGSSSHANNRFELGRLKRLVELGWPAAAQLTLEVGVFAAASALAGRLEPQFLAAHNIVLNLAGLSFMVPLGVASAGAVRVGHAVGRGDFEGARRAGWVALALGAAFMSVAAALFVSSPDVILHLFTSDPDVVATGVTLLLVAAVFQPGFPFCPPNQGFYTPTRLSAHQISSSHIVPLPAEAAVDVEPTHASAFRAFLRHRSTLMLFLRRSSAVSGRPLSSRHWQRPDPPQHVAEQPTGQMPFCQQEPVVPGVLYQPAPGFHQAPLETCERPALDPRRQDQSAPQIAQVVGQDAQL